MQGKLSSALVPVLGVFLITGSALGQTASPQPKSSTSPAPKAQKRSAPPNRVVPAPPALEPRAIDILKAMSDKLAGAHTLTFTAVELFEHSSRQGNPLAYSTRYEVTLQRPDKLKVVIPGDGPASEFYYNGKTMTAYAPVENMAAVAPAPPTIDQMLEQAYKTAAIYYPFADLIVADPYKDMASDIKLAYYIGQSHVLGGGTTDMVAYIVNGVFIQLWVDTDDKMPRLMRAVFLDDPEQLRHELAMTDWKIDPSLPDDAFTSARAADAKPIAFAHPQPPASSTARPTGKAPITKAK